MAFKRFLPFILMLAVCFLVLSACSLFPDEEDGLKPPLVEPVKPRLSIHEVSRGKVSKEYRSHGVLQTLSQTKYSFETDGKIKEIFVEKGDQVKQGEVLMEQDITGLDMTLLKSELQLEQKKWDLQQAVQNEESATLIKIRELEHSVAQASYQEALDTLNHSRLISDMDGTITFSIEQDETAYRFTDGEVLAIVSNSSELTVMISNAGSDANEITVGMKAEISYHDQSYEGVVVQTPESAESSASEAEKNRVYIRFNEQPKDAQFGESVEVSVLIAEKEDTVFIPKSALRTFSGRSYVLLLDGESRREVDVEVGLETSTVVEILDGLSVGDQLIQ